MMILGSVHTAQAGLQAVDPGPYLAAYGFYPAWYEDTTGLRLELCLSQTVSPNPAAAGGFLCVLLPEPGFDPNLPIVFPTNWGGENFWFTGDAAMTVGGNDMLLITAVEAAFGTDEVVNGDQISFARVRLRIDIPSPGGTYVVTHPYGTKTFTNVAPGRRGINDTVDIGIGAPGNFTGALAGQIGPFLRAADQPGGTPTPIVIAATGETFIGDPNVEQFVTGGPNGNFFRVEGPGIGTNAAFPCDSAPAPTDPNNCVETKLFAVSGKVFDGRLPTAVIVDRSTYSRSPLGESQIDVFATSTASATLSMRDALVGGVNTSMTPDGSGKFYGKQLNAAVVPPPPFVVVRAEDTPGNTRPAETSSPVVDVVKITRAAYALDTKTLLIEATSSDTFAPLPILRVVGLGCPTPEDPCILQAAAQGANNTLNVPDVEQPPARITVVSSQGGRDTEPVQIVPTINIAPVANPDSVSATQGVAVVINLVGNDTDLGGAIDPGSIALVPDSGPAGGTAQFNVPAPGQVTYTSTAEFFGTDTFRYTVKDNVGLTSNEATVTVRVNGRPIANPDSASSAGLAVNINVLGNDSDPDNNLPLTVANLTQPAAGTGTAAVQSNNTVTYTPAVGFTGDATFTYQARDSLGALSSVAATVTVTVTATANQPPAANPDTATTRVATAVNIAVLANDTDPEGNTPLTVVNVTAPANGTAVRQANNTITYTPALGFSGQDTFTYQARDSLGGVSAPAIVTVTVTPENITATAQARVRNGRADWTVTGTTDVVTGSQGGNVITVRLARTNEVIGQAVPDNRGRWRLSVRNAIIPVTGDQVAVTSRYTTTPRLFGVTVR
jgi:hypothetical protein